MSVYAVEVDVALQRPPRADAIAYFILEADSGQAAELLACQWAASHRRVTMPIHSLVVDWEDDSA